MNSTIAQAIREKRCLSFTYDGYPRVVEPHTYGLSRKGEEVFRAFQVSGGHLSSHNEPWHLFSVSKTYGLSLTDKIFSGPRPGYKRGDNHIPTIFVEL
jgi:hypothetical protein